MKEYSIWSTLQNQTGAIYDLVICRQAVVVKDKKIPETERALN